MVAHISCVASLVAGEEASSDKALDRLFSFSPRDTAVEVKHTQLVMAPKNNQ